jgi:hypothetical protein
MDFTAVEKRVEILKSIEGKKWKKYTSEERKVWITHLWAKMRLRFYLKQAMDSLQNEIEVNDVLDLLDQTWTNTAVAEELEDL